MKKLIPLLALSLTLGTAQADELADLETSAWTAYSTLLPTILPLQISFASVLSVQGTIQARGVAYGEQLKDDLVNLNDDVVAGHVNSLDEIRQPALRELAKEIQENQDQMEEIASVVKSDSEFVRVITAIAISLK